MSNALYAQIARGFTAALRHAGIPCTWTPAGGEAIAFSVIKNPAPPDDDGVDRNRGDNAAGSLTALAADIGATLPEQGDIIAGTDGLDYRIATVRHVPGHPLIHFDIGHISTAAA